MNLINNESITNESITNEPINNEINTILLSNGIKIDIKINKDHIKKNEDDSIIINKLRNITSSSAGAGSNFFHSYRRMKSIEEDRLNKMEEEYQYNKERNEFNEKRKNRITSYLNSTNKKSERRKRKKEKIKEKTTKKNILVVKQ